MVSTRLRAPLLLGAICLACVALGAAQDPAPSGNENEKTLYANSQETFSPGFAVGDVAVAEPEIADYKVLPGRREMLLYGKAPGTTTLTLWDQKRVQRAAITITVISREDQQAEKDLTELVADFPSVKVRRVKGKLVLTGVSLNSIIFADRPVRAAGHDLTAHVIEDWAKGSDNFAKDPPNATVSGFSKDGGGVKDAVVVLKNPKLEGDQLTFDVDVLEGDLKGADGAASIFIDIIGRPLTPMSYAGVARRTAYRGAYYAAGAAAAAAAGAAAAYAPYYRPPCGPYPYPPCY